VPTVRTTFPGARALGVTGMAWSDGLVPTAAGGRPRAQSMPRPAARRTGSPVPG
jgi:hypothetical protein